MFTLSPWLETLLLICIGNLIPSRFDGHHQGHDLLEGLNVTPNAGVPDTFIHVGIERKQIIRNLSLCHIQRILKTMHQSLSLGDSSGLCLHVLALYGPLRLCEALQQPLHHQLNDSMRVGDRQIGRYAGRLVCFQITVVHDMGPRNITLNYCLSAMRSKRPPSCSFSPAGHPGCRIGRAGRSHI